MFRLLTSMTWLFAASQFGVLGAVAEDLEGFPLGQWNKVACHPAEVGAESTLRVPLPAGRVYRELAVLAPGGRFFSVNDTPSPQGMTHRSDELQPGSTFDIEIAQVVGYYSGGPERVFTQQGDYTIVVGWQFETDAPSVSAWCRIRFVSR